MLDVKNSNNFVFCLIVISEIYPLCTQPKSQSASSEEMLFNYIRYNSSIFLLKYTWCYRYLHKHAPPPNSVFYINGIILALWPNIFLFLTMYWYFPNYTCLCTTCGEPSMVLRLMYVLPSVIFLAALWSRY